MSYFVLILSKHMPGCITLKQGSNNTNRIILEDKVLNNEFLVKFRSSRKENIFILKRTCILL